MTLSMHRRGAQSQARRFMTHRALTTRLPLTGDGYSDPDGHPLPEGTSPNVIYADLPCRAWYGKVVGEVEDGDKTAVVNEVQLLVPADADVREEDTITEIRDRAGRLVFDGRMNITAVVQQVDHQQVVTRRVV